MGITRFMDVGRLRAELDREPGSLSARSLEAAGCPPHTDGAGVSRKRDDPDGVRSKCASDRGPDWAGAEVEGSETAGDGRVRTDTAGRSSGDDAHAGTGSGSGGKCSAGTTVEELGAGERLDVDAISGPIDDVFPVRKPVAGDAGTGVSPADVAVAEPGGSSGQSGGTVGSAPEDDTGAGPGDDVADETADRLDAAWAALRARPAAAAVPLVGVALVVYLVAGLISGGGTPGVEGVQAAAAAPPVLEIPRVREAPYTLEEVRLALDRARRDDADDGRPGGVDTTPRSVEERGTRETSLPEAPGKLKETLPRLVRPRYRQVRAGGRRSSRTRRAGPEATSGGRTVTVIRRTASGVVVERVERRRRRGRAFLGPAGFAKKAEDGASRKQKPGLSLPVGAVLRAELRVGVSTAFGRAPVLARTTEDLVDGKRVLVPAGSTLSGRLSAGRERVFVDFRKITLPDGRTETFRGYAVSGKLPGVRAVVKESDTGSGESSYLARGAIRTAQGALFGVTGTVAHDLVRNVGEEGLADASRQAYRAPTRTLELAAGTRFDVVVTGE